MTRRKPKANSPKSALQPLDQASVEALNRAFYASDPGDHLSLRLQHLLRVASQTDAELRAEEKTYKFGELALTIPSTENDPADEDAHKRLVLVESEMLLHHAAETLLRLFFAHALRPQVPWIELDRLRGPGQFKRELRSRVLNVERSTRLRSHVGLVFIGSREPRADLADDARTIREAGVDRIIEYLRHFASVLIDGEDIYNGAKHGLAVQAGEPALRIADIAALSVEGPAVSHLRKQKSEAGGREWVVETQWINLEQEFSFVFLAAWLVRAVWTTARIHYVGWPMPEGGLTLPGLSVPDVIEAAKGSSGSMISAISLPPVFHSPPDSGTDLLIQQIAAETDADPGE